MFGTSCALRAARISASLASTALCLSLFAISASKATSALFVKLFGLPPLLLRLVPVEGEDEDEDEDDEKNEEAAGAWDDGCLEEMDDGDDGGSDGGPPLRTRWSTMAASSAFEAGIWRRILSICSWRRRSYNSN